MNKKSRIILIVVVIVLALAAGLILYFTLRNGGATQINFDTFVEYIENNKYEEGDKMPGATEGKETYKVLCPNDEGVNEEVPNYRFNTKHVLQRLKKDKDGNYLAGDKDSDWESVPVIVGVNFSEYKMYGSVKEGGKTISRYYAIGPSFYSSPSDNSLLNSWMKEFDIDVSYKDPNAGSVWSSILPIAGVILVCVVFWLIMRSTISGGSKAMSFAKTKARVSTNIKVRFTDVAGAEEEKVELAEVVEFLKQPKKFADLGARIPKGVLLIGPPGTGKTLFAKAVAGEAGVPFFSVSGSDFVEMYVGVGASRVRDLFDVAKKNQPCIIFIDEIDAVGRHRGAGLGGGNDEREQTLNQILVQMDGFENNEGVIVMAATNRSDILDPALTRPGRFDRQVFVNLPDVKGREQILKVHARNKPLAPDVNLKAVARLSAGFSGADLANLLNEAAILAARANKQFIGNAELYEAFDKVAMGPAKKSKVVTEPEKRLTAFHESGHCILAKLCPNCDPVHEVTIIPRGNAGGFTMMRPDSDRAYYSRNYMLDDICMALGGRVAEELVIKDISSGASGDIKQATKFARLMVTELGMSEKLGLISYSDDSQPVFIGKDMATHSSYSEETAKMIDDEVREIVSTQHERARKLLSENRSILDNMARVLIEKETIYTEEVEMLMEGKSYTEVLQYMEEHENEHTEKAFKKYSSDEPFDKSGTTDNE
ncbi:MAG: ATP-dependent zinc metalloprotease FtsH [Clostridiales bacterium]|nr:ATP-dependent zinc metalloprotease FtsH [Clostridiales bacterium]